MGYIIISNIQVIDPDTSELVPAKTADLFRFGNQLLELFQTEQAVYEPIQDHSGVDPFRLKVQVVKK